MDQVSRRRYDTLLLNIQGDDWNIYWANVWTVKQIFNPETGHRLGEMQ